jgi:plastocyanin
MNSRTMRRGALTLIATAAVGAAGMTAMAATTPTATRNLSNATELSYKPATLRVVVPRGKAKIRVNLRYRNTGFSEHNIAVRGRGVNKRSRVIGPNRGIAVSAVLAPGTYTYFCSVPGHEAAGMKGTLRVIRGR